ncbi:MAG: hypothetical protein WA667_05215 [Candidatus Nitrosopolaris sp.]
MQLQSINSKLNLIYFRRIITGTDLEKRKFRPGWRSSVYVAIIFSTLLLSPLFCYTLSSLQAVAQFTSGLNNNINNNNQGFNSNSSTNLLQYTSPNLGFSIGYPADSQVNESSDGVTFTSPSGNVLWVQVSNSSGMQLSDYGQNVINNLTHDTQFQIHNSSDSTLAGYPSHFIIFSDNRSPYIHGLSDWTVLGNTEYSVNLFLDSSKRKDSLALTPAINILNSFQLVNQQQGPSPSPSTNLLQYTSPNLGFSIGYPAGWTVNERQNGVTFVDPQEPYSVVMINLTSNTNNQLSDDVNMRINELRNEFPGFHLILSNNTTLANNVASMIFFSFDNNQHTLYVRDDSTILGNRIYELIFITAPTSVSNFIPILQGMRDSFHIGQITGDSTPSVPGMRT